MKLLITYSRNKFSREGLLVADTDTILDGEYEEITVDHVLETLDPGAQQTLLNRLVSHLTADGSMYIKTYNLEWLVDAYKNNKPDGWYADLLLIPKKERDKLRVKDWHSHTLWFNYRINEYRCMLDMFVLKELLKESGLKNIKVILSDRVIAVKGKR